MALTSDTALRARAGAVRAWLDDRAEEMAALLEQLVAIESENPPGRALGRCGRVLRDAMEALGLSPELIDLPPARELEEPCIVRGSAGAAARTVYFHGHFDVVPSQSREQFRPRRENGRIVGRGSADMKGGLVSMLYGAAAAQDLGLLGAGRIVLHLVCDEETGSVTGSGHLREHGMIDPDAVAMLTPEPTGGVVWHASRGAITLRVEVEGRPAHVGQAHLGVNAFEHMVAVAEPLARLARDLLDRRTAYPLESDEARGSMMVVGGASASGANFNVVPDRAWFSVDRRFNPEEDLDQELERLTRTIEDVTRRIGARVSVDVVQRQPSAATDRHDPAALALDACVTAVECAPPPFELCPGVLETRWYAQLGIPAFAYGAGRLDVSHGPQEFIDEAAMRRCGAVYALFAASALAAGRSSRGDEASRSPHPRGIGRVSRIEISLREITDANRRAVERVAVTPGQESHVAGVVDSLAEAAATPAACPWYRAIYVRDEVVGFVMISDGIPAGRPEYLGPYYLWRLLIDADWQRRGVGTAALDIVVEYVRTRPNAHTLLTSVVPGPASPMGFYLRYGFSRTGQVFEGEDVLELTLIR